MVFGAKVKTPLASIDSGPVVIGVTSVFAAVTPTVFKVSLAVTLPTVVGTVVLGTWVPKVVSSLAQIILFIIILVADDSQVTEPVASDVVTS